MYQVTEEFIVDKTITIHAGIDDVWDALVSPAKIRQWLNVTDVEVSWRIGSPLLYSAILEGKQYQFKGTVLNYSHQKLLQYSYWSSLSRLTDLPENHTVVTISVEESGGQTLLSVKQERFSGEDDYRHANFHWEMTIRAFRKLVEGKFVESRTD